MSKQITISLNKLLEISEDRIRKTLVDKIKRMRPSLSDKSLERELNNFEKNLERELVICTRELAQKTYEYIRTLATKELKWSREIYIKNINFPQEVSPGVYVISLKSGANFIETGEGFDMKPGLLKNSKHSASSGFDYKIIPFKHNRNSPSASAYAREISTKIRKELTRKKILIKKIEMAQSSIKNRKKRSVPKTGKVEELTYLEKDNKRVGKMLHKISIYQNLINKAKNSSIKNVSRDIFTFRTVTNSPEQKNKWIYPDKQGKNFFDQAEDFVIKEWKNNFLPRIIRKLE